jgi:hypothetical protein
LFTGGQYQNCPLGAASNVYTETTLSRNRRQAGKERYDTNPSIFGQGPPGEAQQMEEKSHE